MVNEPLNKVETAAALAAVRVVLNSAEASDIADLARTILGDDNPLKRAEIKLASNLDKFNQED